MKWLGDFQSYVDELKKHRPNLVISGDYNICHRSVDIHDPIRNATNSGFLPEEREWMTKFLDSGFIDTFRQFEAGGGHYSWWTYRAGARANNVGWRIDYFMASAALKGRLKRGWIEPQVMGSDHCPVGLEIT